uniref:Uncharacterized protein n=1 Tax=Rhizophora mucronata TaxID=61149 RepID=A0A2P2QTG9_RHIMU
MLSRNTLISGKGCADPTFHHQYRSPKQEPTCTKGWCYPHNSYSHKKIFILHRLDVFAVHHLQPLPKS